MNTMTYTVKAFAAVQLDRGLFSRDLRSAHSATVELESGDVIMVSRYDDEDYWVLDAQFSANGFPVFSNGEGSRCTAARTLRSDHEISLDLDARVRS